VTETTTREWREALALFDRLAAADEAERGARLAALRVSDPAVHARVVALLEADEAAAVDGFLDLAALESLAAADAARTVRVGDRCGPYLIEERIGAGGMGEVWRARRDDGLYEGEVAIKTLHAHLASHGVRERFVREGRLLARLSHPNIARLLDAGVTPAGGLYLVLEHVDGIRLDEWCDRERLGVEARLRLFLDVCAAAAHAHASLVVHRDLKPSNVLVTPDGTVKLLDFGIAKLVEADAGEAARTELTRLWGSVLTPEYAAPEQLRGEPVTTATDVHALGVMLHRLLTGSLPYGAAAADRAAVERAILDGDAPTLPEALARLDATALAAVAEARSTTPRQLRRTLRGDLAAVVGQALRERPADRYASVLALADDLRNYLEYQPVSARPNSRAYRAGRFVRRHRYGVAAATLAVVALLAGFAGAAWQAERAREEARRANAVRDFLLGIFEQNSVRHPDGAAARRATAEELLGIGAERIGAELDDHPGTKAEILGTIAGLYRDLSLPDRAVGLYEQQLAALERATGGRGPEWWRALVGLGIAHAEGGRYEEAGRWLEAGLRAAEATDGPPAVETAMARAWLGQIAYRTLPPEDPTAERHFRDALALLETHHPRDPNRVQALLGLARVQEYRGDLAAAEATLLGAITVAKEQAARPGGDRRNVAGAHQLLGDLLRRQRRYAEAEQHLGQALREFEQALGAQHPFTADARRERGRFLAAVGRPAEAAAELQAALASLEQARGAEDPELVAGARVELGHVEFARGRIAEARDLYERSIGVWRKASPDSPFLLNTLGRQARVLEAAGDLRGADVVLAEFRAGVLATRGERHAWYAHSLVSEAGLRLARGEAAAAAVLYERVLAEWPAQSGELPANWLVAAAGRVRAYLASGDAGRALAAARTLEAQARPLLAAGSLQPEEEAQLRLRLGQALLAAGDRAAARLELERAVVLRRALDVPGSPWLTEAKDSLARCSEPA
jgi:serine/threonine-protein kinase